MKLTIPNQLTLLRISLTPLFLWFFLRQTPRSQLVASLFFTLAAFTDWYDGWHARRFGVITRWGQFMDPLADKILVSTALIAFAHLGYVFSWMVWVIVVRDFVVTGLRIYALYRGTPIVTHLLGKWKTFLQMSTIFFILIMVNWWNFYGEGAHSYRARYTDPIGLAMGAVTALTIVSGLIYLWENFSLVVNLLRNLVRIYEKNT